MEERPPIWRVAANKLNKQSRTADKGWLGEVRVVKSRRMRWAGHVARMGQGERGVQGSGGET